MIILAGAEYGSGSSRDWAAKGPMLLVHSGDLWCSHQFIFACFAGLFDAEFIYYYF